jgi:hypothetical protein
MMNKTDAIIAAATNAADEITSLWWTRPEKGGSIKAQVVRDIITRHLIGIPLGPAVNPWSQIDTLEELP